MYPQEESCPFVAGKLDAGGENTVDRMNKRHLRDQKQYEKRSPPVFTKI